jgi:hypothetical protein
VPISRVGGGARGEGTCSLHERAGAGRVPERHGASREVNLVGKVMPDVGNPVDIPFGLAADEPAEVVIGGSGGVTIDPTVLHLGEVGLATKLLVPYQILRFEHMTYKKLT